MRCSVTKRIAALFLCVMLLLSTLPTQASHSAEKQGCSVLAHLTRSRTFGLHFGPGLLPRDGRSFFCLRIHSQLIMLLPPIKDSFSLAGTSILTDPKVDSLCPTRLRLRQRSMALHKE